MFSPVVIFLLARPGSSRAASGLVEVVVVVVWTLVRGKCVLSPVSHRVRVTLATIAR